MTKQDALEQILANMRRIFVEKMGEVGGEAKCSHCGRTLTIDTPALSYNPSVGAGPLYCGLLRGFFCSEEERHREMGGAPFKGMRVD
jgi:hypothetical protein